MRYTVSVTPFVRQLREINAAFTVVGRFLPYSVLVFPVAFFATGIPWLIAIGACVFLVSASMFTVRRRVLDRRARSFVFLAETAYFGVALCGAVGSEARHVLTTRGEMPVSHDVLALISVICKVLLVGWSVAGLVCVVWAAFLSPGASTLRAIRNSQERLADARVHADVLGGRPTPPLRRLAVHDGGSLVAARGKVIAAVLAAVGIGYVLNYSLVALGVPVPLSLLLSLAPCNIALVSAVNRWRLSADEARSVDRREPVLVMRAFADDEIVVEGEGMDFPVTFPSAPEKHRLEQLLAHGLRSYGPSVTIGSPQEPFPRPGAARQYATDASWRGAVRKLIREAPCLVYVVAASEHLEWELKEGFRHRGAGSMLFVFPPVPDGDRRRRWEDFRKFAEPALGLELGEAGSRSGSTPLLALVAGGDLVFLEGEDHSGRNYLVAARIAAQLVARRLGGVGELKAFMAGHLPELRLVRR